MSESATSAGQTVEAITIPISLDKNTRNTLVGKDCPPV